MTNVDTSPDASWFDLPRVRRTIVVVDVVESVRLVQLSATGFAERWTGFVREVKQDVLQKHVGRMVKHLGDGMLLEFESVLPAVLAALDMHGRIGRRNIGQPADAAIGLRIGITTGEVIEHEIDVFGSAVNIASRLAAFAQPHETLASAAVCDQIVPGLDVDIEDVGDCYLKHIDEPVRVVRLSGAAPPKPWIPQGHVNSMRPTLAVVPFETLDTSGMQQLLGDAVADEVIAALSRNAGLTVISRLSTAAFRGRPGALAEVQEHLRADHVLSGRIHLSGTRLRLVVLLTEVRSGAVVWSSSLGGTLDAIFGGDDPLVSEVAHRVSEALVVRQLERARRQPMATLESYCLLMAAVSIMHGLSSQDFDRAREMLEHLQERDRRHPAPYAWLAKWHVLKVQQGWSTDLQRDTQMALDQTRRALDLDPRSSLSLSVDGFVHCNLLKDMAAATAKYELALSENPNDPLAWLFMGTMCAFQGRGAEAMESVERALELSPLDPTRYFFESLSATAALSAGLYEQAIERARHSLRLNRKHTSTLRVITIAQVQLGRLSDARATATALLALEPGLTIKSYLHRSPSSGYPTGVLWSESLAAAGVPIQ